MILFGAIVASAIHEKGLGDDYENQSRKIVINAAYHNFSIAHKSMFL